MRIPFTASPFPVSLFTQQFTHLLYTVKHSRKTHHLLQIPITRDTIDATCPLYDHLPPQPQGGHRTRLRTEPPAASQASPRQPQTARQSLQKPAKLHTNPHYAVTICSNGTDVMAVVRLVIGSDPKLSPVARVPDQLYGVLAATCSRPGREWLQLYTSTAYCTSQDTQRGSVQAMRLFPWLVSPRSPPAMTSRRRHHDARHTQPVILLLCCPAAAQRCVILLPRHSFSLTLSSFWPFPSDVFVE